MQEKRKEWMREFGLLNLGTFLTAIGSYFFKFPNNFSTGGVTGLSVVLTHYFPNLSNGTIVSVINVALMVVGLILLGKEFGFKTFYVTIAFSVMLKLFETVTPLTQPLTDQPFMELLFGVFLPAWGSAMLFNIGSSTGGTDIIAMIIKKYSTMNISTALLLCDLIIVVLAFFVFDILTGLCSILGLMAKTLVIDKVIERMKLNKFFTIVCDHPEPICDFITEELDHSATTYHAEGAYSHAQRTVILTVVDVKQAILLQRFIKKNEPTAFITVTKSSEIIGKGFSNYI